MPAGGSQTKTQNPLGGKDDMAKLSAYGRSMVVEWSSDGVTLPSGGVVTYLYRAMSDGHVLQKSSIKGISTGWTVSHSASRFWKRDPNEFGQLLNKLGYQITQGAMPPVLPKLVKEPNLTADF